MATASATYDWVTYGRQVRVYLGLNDDMSEDEILSLWLTAACADCDAYCGTLPTVHSPLVWLGILEWIKAMRNYFQRDSGAGVTAANTGALSEQYARGAGGLLGRKAASELWASSCAHPELWKPYNEPFGG